MGENETDWTEFPALLQRANDGEDGAFDQLAARTAERLRGLVQRMLRRYPHVRRWEETDDVLQAALIRLHRSLTQVQPESTRAFFGLAVTQIRRTLIDLARHYYGALGAGAHHHTDGAGRVADEAAVPLIEGVADDLQDGLDTLQQWTSFHEAVDRLPEEERETFRLVWYGGLSQRDVAELLGVSPRTIIRRMNRARLTLHDQLQANPPT